MFNPKERLEQIRKSKQAKEQGNSLQADSPPPLFQSFPSQHSDHNDQTDILARMARLENQVNELSSELTTSKQIVSSLRRQNGELQTKILKLQYENSQLKIVNRPGSQKNQESARRQSAVERVNPVQKQQSAMKKAEGQVSEMVQQILLPEVEQTLEQVKKEPIENILRRKEQNFRALKVDPRHVNGGNKVMREFAGICKDYGKTMKKPVLVIKLQADDFQ